MPDVKLPENLVANPDIEKTVEAIQRLKGLEVDADGCKLLSQSITDTLGIYCGVLSGANIANEVARGNWSETSISSHNKPFSISNVAAQAAGSAEGAGRVTTPQGRHRENRPRRNHPFLYPVSAVVLVPGGLFAPESTTFTEESAGVADLITTCSGGRNVRVARYMIENKVDAWEAEAKLLNGQSSQGIITAKEVHELLENYKLQDEFPLFEATYRIIYENADINEWPVLLETN
ncbi:glycerol-3-phosphate dehydrogenase [Clavispora lusitaniae]|nr:glycerol-3-phosphate dehydrogenase [Clavispora lusitaniae]